MNEQTRAVVRQQPVFRNKGEEALEKLNKIDEHIKAIKLDVQRHLSKHEAEIKSLKDRVDRLDRQDRRVPRSASTVERAADHAEVRNLRTMLEDLSASQSTQFGAVTAQINSMSAMMAQGFGFERVHPEDDLQLDEGAAADVIEALRKAT